MKEPEQILELQERLALYEDMSAYRQLYHLLFDRLFLFSYSYTKSRETAEEIVSDVFIKLWQMRTELSSIHNLKVYLYTITKNFSLNYLTRHYKNPVVSIDDVAAEFMATAFNPEELCISADIMAKIKEAMNTLPAQCRLIFQLVREDGLRYKEVAAILNISVLTVRNQVAIATKKMAEALPASLDSNAILLSNWSKS